MVEGPLLHRLAFAHRKLLFGQKFTATSPTGRFADGAAAIDGLFVSHIEVHGKNIFYFFTRERVGEIGVLEKVGDDASSGPLEEAVVVHMHLGMSGSFRTYKFPGPVPREATRLRMYNEELGVEAHLSAMVCDYGTIELYRKKILELGPDPLREDADKELLWASMQKTKRSIGAVLMDQSLVAGIGNIYRAEILFVVGLHPDQPANTVSRDKFEFLWEQSVRQMEIGVEVGNIITVLPEDAGKPLRSAAPSKLRYVYNQKACGRCGGVITVWSIAQRSVYACEACQPPPLDSPVVSKRALRKIPVDEADSISAENSDDVHDDGATPEKRPTRKRVAKGGKVMVHQAYKNEDPKGLPESFVVPIDEEKFLERLGKGGQIKEEFTQTAPMQTEVDSKTGIKYSSKTRRARQSAGNIKTDQPESVEYTVKGSATSEKPLGRRSARVKNQAVAERDQGFPALGFRGKLEFPSPRVTSLSVQNFPTTSVSYARKSLFLSRPLNGSCSMKFSCATFPFRHFIRPLSSAQPIGKVAALGSTFFAGAILLRGNIAGVL
ncbi:hypothetical protein KC19_8G067800 [Ceratodon purpureus]|uniref:DNA-(apurinic or apyrimidinic site) lyase n=1 Tax=Ceratodon purpureus TaxID=3225 RepID=A0A8T0H463_CERPU|nr:hypothetical protein KC19_8G067800 [Ceratodon purpureus]